jgi:hypothetical protein
MGKVAKDYTSFILKQLLTFDLCIEQALLMRRDPDETVFMTDPYVIGAAQSAHYSKAICRLIKRCLRYNPDDRPDFDGIRKTIDRYTDAALSNPDLSQGMRHDTASAATNAAQGLLPEIEDRYRLGMVRP